MRLLLLVLLALAGCGPSRPWPAPDDGRPAWMPAPQERYPVLRLPHGAFSPRA